MTFSDKCHSFCFIFKTFSISFSVFTGCCEFLKCDERLKKANCIEDYDDHILFKAALSFVHTFIAHSLFVVRCRPPYLMFDLPESWNQIARRLKNSSNRMGTQFKVYPLQIRPPRVISQDQQGDTFMSKTVQKTFPMQFGYRIFTQH